MSPGEALPWRTTAAFRRGLVLGVGGLLVGVAAGSVEVALLAVPLALCSVGALRRLPALASAPTQVHAAATAAVGEPLPVRVEVTAAPAAAGAELVVVRVPGAPPAGRHRGRGAAVGPAQQEPTGSTVAVQPHRRRRALTTTAVPTTWGRRTVARPDALCVAEDGMLALGPLPGPLRDLLVVPAVAATAAGPLPPHPTSVVGRHRSRRAGDGSELYVVDALRPGDRMRHIDWRATARRGRGPGGLEVFVRRAVVEAEGQVVLLLDTRADLDADVATWSVPRALVGGALGPGSSLDLTVSTAAALGAAHLEAGDRVGTVDLTVPTGGVRAAGGRRQLHRLRTALASVSATGTPPGPQTRDRTFTTLPRRLLDQVPARALAVVLSPFLDDRVSDLALALQRHGRSTLGVDCLPTALVPDRGSAVGEAALALVLAEREQRLAGLAAAGVVVLPAGGDLSATTRRLVRARERAAR